jgi:hypothetical protein
MADMRLSDWITIFLALGTTILCLFGSVLLIAAWPRLVSIVSRVKTRMAEEGAARRAYRQRVYNMSSNKVSHTLFPIEGSHRSYAVEQGSEQPGTGGAFHVPPLWEQLGTLSDDELLDILARVVDEDGEPRFAESKIGRFVGGRLEDRIAQVRAVRGVEVETKSRQYATPIANRPTKASYFDPDYPYQAPA